VRGLDSTDVPYIGAARPWGGLHPDGLYILFADGAVHFLKATVEPGVFQALAVIHSPNP
jgi:hypothetical protein